MMDYLLEIYSTLKSLWVIWLTLVFLGLIAWVYWPSHKSSLEAHRNIPFNDGPDKPVGKDA